MVTIRRFRDEVAKSQNRERGSGVEASQARSKKSSQSQADADDWRATSSSLFENEAHGYNERPVAAHVVGIILLPRRVCMPPLWKSKSHEEEEEKKWSGV